MLVRLCKWSPKQFPHQFSFIFYGLHEANARVSPSYAYNFSIRLTLVISGHGTINILESLMDLTYGYETVACAYRFQYGNGGTKQISRT